MNRICTICARGGSKGVKNKNIREINGLPLIAYSIRQAKQSGLFSAVSVSSDSEEILAVARQWGADLLVKRPEHMATDSAAKIPAIQHCVRETEERQGIIFDTVVDLDATSPLRDKQDIVNAVAMLERERVSNVITGAPARRSPYFNLVEINSSGAVELSKKLAHPIVRRQDAPKTYDMNASIYVWSRDALFTQNGLFQADTLLYVMPEERSVDIDSELDFKMVELLLAEKGNQGHVE